MENPGILTTSGSTGVVTSALSRGPGSMNTDDQDPVVASSGLEFPSSSLSAAEESPLKWGSDLRVRIGGSLLKLEGNAVME